MANDLVCPESDGLVDESDLQVLFLQVGHTPPELHQVVDAAPERVLVLVLLGRLDLLVQFAVDEQRQL